MRKAVILAAVLASSAVWATSALADASPTPVPQPIGPNQFFAGLVNGSQGSATIIMNCGGGPVRPGETGHPIGGQTVSVRQLFPPAADSTIGFTGNASTIAASLLVPSAAAANATPPIPLAVFWLYGQQVPIPTTLTLPCYGHGAVVYNPVQGGPNAHANTVAVTFVFLGLASGSGSSSGSGS